MPKKKKIESSLKLFLRRKISFTSAREFIKWNGNRKPRIFISRNENAASDFYHLLCPFPSDKFLFKNVFNANFLFVCFFFSLRGRKIISQHWQYTTKKIKMIEILRFKKIKEKNEWKKKSLRCLSRKIFILSTVTQIGFHGAVRQ